MKCPICKKTELEEKALICPECKASSPYALLDGFSPVKKVADELQKSEGRKKRNVMLTVALGGALLLFIGSVVYAIAIKKQGTVIETVVDEEAIEKYEKENAGLTERIQELGKYKEENSKLIAEIKGLKESQAGSKKVVVDNAAVEKYKEENSKLMAEVKELKGRKAGSKKVVVDNAVVEKQKTENTELTAKIQGLEKYRVLYEKEYYVHKKENTKLKTEIDELKKRKPVSTEKVASTEKSSKSSEEMNKKSKAKISELNNKIKKLKQQLDDKSKLLTQAQAQPQGGTTTYIVKDGENLFSIAKKLYGSGFKYKKIASDNNISNPDAIRKGQKLTIYQ